LRVTQKRDVKVVQNRKFRKIAEFKCREICAPENREINASRKSHVIRYTEQIRPARWRNLNESYSLSLCTNKVQLFAV